MDIRYDSPGPISSAFARSMAPWQFIVGPFGSGKSITCIMKILRLCSTQNPSQDGIRRSRWAVVRNTNQQLTDTTLKSWREWVIEGPLGTWQEVRRTWLLKFNDVEAEIMFRALDKPEDKAKLLSMELTGAWINEFREVPQVLLGDIYDRTRRFPNPTRNRSNWYGIIGDTNAPIEGGDYYKMFEHGLDLSMTRYNQDYSQIITTRPDGGDISERPFTEVFWQPSGVSPVAENRANLDPQYYEDMIRKPSTSPDGVNVSVHAKYATSMSGIAVFKNSYDASIHESPTRLEFDPTAPLLAGMDFGRDPSLAFGQFDQRGRFQILRELCVNNMSLTRFLPDLKRFIAYEFGAPTLVICGDPAGDNNNGLVDATAYKMMRDAGYRMVLPPNGKSNRLADRLSAVEYFLCSRIPGMIIDPSCDLIIRAFRGGYKYSNDNSPTPVKDAYSHPMDAVQYLCQYAASGRLPVMGGFLPEPVAFSRGPADRIMGY